MLGWVPVGGLETSIETLVEIFFESFLQYLRGRAAVAILKSQLKLGRIKEIAR